MLFWSYLCYCSARSHCLLILQYLVVAAVTLHFLLGVTEKCNPSLPLPVNRIKAFIYCAKHNGKVRLRFGDVIDISQVKPEAPFKKECKYLN